MCLSSDDTCGANTNYVRKCDYRYRNFFRSFCLYDVPKRPIQLQLGIRVDQKTTVTYARTFFLQSPSEVA